MAKQKSHQTRGPRASKNTISVVVTTEMGIKSRGAARRDAQIASGHNPLRGSGYHDADQKTKNRRDRRQGKRDSHDY